MIGGKQRENTGSTNIEFVPQVGVFEAEVVAINPTNEELGALLGREIEKEIEYTKETDEGDDAITLSFWVMDKKSGDLFNPRFFLVNKERENKDKTKKQYINLSGATSWADDPNNLQDWFSKLDYKVAKKGEEELYNFLRSWLNRLDWNTNEDMLDTKKLFKGSVKELKDLMKSEYASTVLCMAVARDAEKDGEKKIYQGVYNRDFLPGNCLKFFTTKGKKMPKMVDKFIKTITDDQYGCTDHYSLEPLHDFDSTLNPNTSLKKEVGSDDSSY